MKKFLIASALALASVSSSFAANFASGDLILGFRADGGQGVNSNVLVDLGAASSFTADNASLFNLGSILSSTYGSNWASRTDLSYGIIGAAGTVTNSTVWASQPETVSGTVETNIFANITYPETGLYANSTINTGRVGYTTFQAYASSLTPVATDVYVGDATLYAGWTLQEAKSMGVSWNFVTPYIDTTLANFSSPSALDGTVYGALDVYKLTKSATTNLGAIGLNSAGNVAFLAFNGTDTNAFGAAVIPEPSTYAAILGALTVAFVALRRRFARAA